MMDKGMKKDGSLSTLKTRSVFFPRFPVFSPESPITWTVLPLEPPRTHSFQNDHRHSQR